MSNKANEMKKSGSISMKSLGYTAKELRKKVEDAEGAVFVGRIGGVAVEFFTGENSRGEWVGFRGQFMAMNEHGEVYESGTAFFPSSIAKSLREKIANGAVEVEIQADIYVEESDVNASGYNYVCEPILTAEKQEKLEKMKNFLFQNTPAIADKTADKNTKKNAA